MQNITKLISALCLSMAVACGSSSGGGGSSSPLQCQEQNGHSGCKASDWDDYNSCVESKCETEYGNCFGSGWTHGDYGGGSCSKYAQCISACKCGDTSCETKCGLPDSACQSCLETADSCASSKCQKPACASSGNTGNTGNTSGSHTCDDLKACCDQQSGAQQTECQSMYSNVKADGDVACNSIYNQLGSFGITCH